VRAEQFLVRSAPHGSEREEKQGVCAKLVAYEITDRRVLTHSVGVRWDEHSRPMG
jgi:hypothetical protein